MLLHILITKESYLQYVTTIRVDCRIEVMNSVYYLVKDQFICASGVEVVN